MAEKENLMTQAAAPLIRPDPMPADARSVLVIKLGALGDFIQSLAAAKVIRHHHFGARITLLTTEPFEEFAKACPYFDVVEADGRPRDPQAIAALARRIRSARYDVIYDLQTSGRSSRYFLALLPKPPLWSGIAPGCSHPHANPARETMHTLDRQADQLWWAGIGPSTPYPIGEAPLPDLEWVRAALRNPPRLQPQFFGINGPYVLMIPGASEEHLEKRWPAEAYGELARDIASHGVVPVVIGHTAEREAAGVIARMEPRVKNLVMRTSLFQVVTLAEHCAAAVGNDTGPMHIAAASGARCVVLFSSASEPERVCPRSPRGVMVLRAYDLANLPARDVAQALRNIGAYGPQGERTSA